jgi:hypothetical protein
LTDPVAKRLTAITASDWSKGDFRYVATLKPNTLSLEVLAHRVGAPVERFDEPGLGEGFVVRAKFGDAFQVGFEKYSASESLSILMRFEKNTCSRDDLEQVLQELGVPHHLVAWFAPELR